MLDDQVLLRAQFWGLWLFLFTCLFVLVGFLYDPLKPSAWFVSAGLGTGFVVFFGSIAIRWYRAWQRQRD